MQDGPITKNATTSSNLKKTADANKAGQNIIVARIEKNRVERWKLTGVVGLSECNLKVLVIWLNIKEDFYRGHESLVVRALDVAV